MATGKHLNPNLETSMYRFCVFSSAIFSVYIWFPISGPLRRVLTRMGAGNLAASLIPENMENTLSYSVLNYLKRLKNQAKQEYDRIVSMTPYKGKFGPEGIKVISRTPLKRELLENPAVRETPNFLKDQITDFPGFMLGLPEKSTSETHPLRNPFDIPRSSLLDQVSFHIICYYNSLCPSLCASVGRISAIQW